MTGLRICHRDDPGTAAAGTAGPARRRATALLGLPVLLFVTAAGSMFALLRLSTLTYERSGSNLLAGIVLTAPWLLALVLFPLLNRVLATGDPARLVLAAEAAGFAVTAALLVVPARLGPYPLVVFAGLVLRGFFESVTRSASAILLRRLCEPAGLDRANTHAEIGRLTGMCAGSALVAPATAGALALPDFLAVNLLTFTCSFGLALTLPRTGAARPAATPRPPAPGAPGAAPGAAGGDPVRRGSLRPVGWPLALFGLTAVWQGFHTVAVNAVPRELLGLPAGAVGTLVALSGAAILAGSLGAALVAGGRADRVPLELWVLAPVVALGAAVLAGRPVPAFAAYAVFMLAFELAYIRCNNRVIAAAPADRMAAVMTVRATVLPLGVILATLAAGRLADAAGIGVTAAGVIALTAAVVAAYRLTRLAGVVRTAWLTGATLPDRSPAREGVPEEVPG